MIVDCGERMLRMLQIAQRRLQVLSDGDAIGQRHHGTDPGDRHQAPTHIIIADDGQQAAVMSIKPLLSTYCRVGG
jgi:hypothetical protein